MESAQWHPVLRYIRRLAESNHYDRFTNATLLARFVIRRDQEAFAALVKRHGPLVMGVGRRMLQDIHEAEDVFQATFLVLVRKASSIAKPEGLAQWLYGVAYRTSLRARRLARRRRFHESRAAESMVSKMNIDFLASDLRHILDEEIQRLPRNYRAPVVLCYFAGNTKEEAARILGIPVGTVSCRLARAREKLRSRLTRRGLALSAGVLTSTLTSESLAAPVSVSLAQATTQAAVLLAAGKSLAGGLVSIKVASLTEGILRAMFLFKLKIAALGIAGALVVGSGAAAVCYKTSVAQEQKVDPPIEDRLYDEIDRLKKELSRAERKLESLKQQRSNLSIPAQREGILVFVGTDLKEGENLPDGQLVTVSVGADKKKYRRLKVGDHVEANQLLGRIDDRLARDEVAVKEKKLTVAEAELITSEKTKEEAEARFRTQQMLFRKNGTSQEELRAAELTWVKYKGEVAAKKAAIEVAQAELNQAKTVVEMHNIRSPVRGIVKSIAKHPGEAAKYLETVFVIQAEGH